MKKILIPALSLLLLQACMSPEMPSRADYIKIDNPTDRDYFIVVDQDTLDLAAYTYLDYQAVAEDAQGNLLNGKHHYVVLDGNKKQLFDTTFTSNDRYLFINPTRSTYVEWTVYYGDDIHEEQYTTLTFDSLEFEGILTEYHSFAFATKAGGEMDCDRSIAPTIEVVNENSNYRFYFFRLPDFFAAYSGFGSIDPKEDARVDLYNMLTDFYNYAVEHKDKGFMSDASLQSWYDQINYEHYSEAMSTLNSNRMMFREEQVDKANRLYDQFQKAPEVESDKLTFTELHRVDYGTTESGILYKRSTYDYNPASGECKSEYHEGPE